MRAPGGSNGSAPRILLVDDDPSGLAMLGLSLRQAGLDVASAAGAEEALRRLREESFDWLVTDARMAPVDGFRLSLAAKRLRPDLRILMISAVYRGDDASGYPIEKLFPKPVPVESLVDWLLGGRHPSTAPPPREGPPWIAF